MRDCAGVKNAQERILRRLGKNALIASFFCLSACTGGFDREPLLEYSTDVVVAGTRAPSVARQLEAGVYLVEVRERDIDLRVSIDAGIRHIELADAQLRHGLHRAVVSLEAPARIRVTLDSVDQRSWKGAAAVRILRWPHSLPGSQPDQRLMGFRALGEASSLIAKDSPDAWRASVPLLREAARQFQAAKDAQSAAEADYQRGHVELGLLFDFEASQRSAESAMAFFRLADDEVGEQRAALLRGLAEFNIACRMGNEIPRGQQRATLNAAARRVTDAHEFFEQHDMESDALAALGIARMHESILGRGENNAAAYESIRRRAQARGDRYFEVIAMRSLAAIAYRKGDVVRAAALYESVLPLIERDRDPQAYAGIRADLGTTLTALGEFDRAQVLHTEALELFSARGDDTHTAREFAALASIQLRSGNVERSLAMLENAFPLYERSRDHEGLVSALRLAGNAAADLGRHDLALGYLRKAEIRDRNGITVDRTRVLIAGELRVLGDLQGAENLLTEVLLTPDASTRADALTERAQLRMRQHRHREALADLREADAAYARLKLDFNRIQSSAALALALLDAGDLPGASAAADTAVAMERRIRGKAADPETRARFLSASYEPYEARIEADLASWPADRNAMWRAFRTADAIRGRSLSDRLAQRTTEAAQPAEASLRARIAFPEQLEIPESRAAVQSVLPDDTAVLAFFVGERRSHAWLLSNRELRHAVLPGRRVLEDLVSASNQWNRSGGFESEGAAFPPLLGNLLDGVAAKRLLILPDGPLNSLPFATLPMPHGAAHEMLVDRFVLGSAPSLAVALRSPAQQRKATTMVAVVSDPVYTPDDRRLTTAALDASRFRGAEGRTERLARLPYSAVEARTVVRAFSGANIIGLAGFDATASRVIDLPSRDLSVLHFATHAVIHKDAPEQSALFLSEYAPDGSPLQSDRLTADDIERSGLRADVVVLSGCATGSGRELRGEGVLGLTYGFLANGSQSVIASLWPVEDALTARFMEEFYAAYRASGRAADALRTAQLRTRSKAGPTVWSSFVVRSNGMP
jgi:CHAT domain-containing protein/tetratricopeptide (TPR) repeat protein